ncbi:MAG: 50S ribosomal protein L24e [archaeon]
MKCSFCSHDLDPGTGKMFVKKDGSIIYLCSNKCEKNMFKLGRKSYNIKWTKQYHEDKDAVRQGRKVKQTLRKKAPKAEKATEKTEEKA